MARTRTSGQGRPKGALNKATKDVKVLASKYAPDALAELGRLAKEAESEAARVAAAKEILDRAYGRAHQTTNVNAEGSMTFTVVTGVPRASSNDRL